MLEDGFRDEPVAFHVWMTIIWPKERYFSLVQIPSKVVIQVNYPIRLFKIYKYLLSCACTI